MKEVVCALHLAGWSKDSISRCILKLLLLGWLAGEISSSEESTRQNVLSDILALDLEGGVTIDGLIESILSSHEQEVFLKTFIGLTCEGRVA